ncbi:MAG: FAD-dependent oxidoreductase, partial [Kiritimatiellae bacterium]|nr:FAD-dependent oxidoreductase [Kiritimatiellia bacterium]
MNRKLLQQDVDDMPKTVGIAGAGIMGRLMALALHEKGWQVSLYDADQEQGTDSCTWVGAGMLAPSCELESAEPDVARMGDAALARWPELLAGLDAPVGFSHKGSLVVAHPGDRSELERLHDRVVSGRADASFMRRVLADDIAELEPGLGTRFSSGLYFPGEAHINNRDLLIALAATLHARGIAWHRPVDVLAVEAGGVLRMADGGATFDMVLDCRGLGARAQLTDLRGVRGELVYLEAPEVALTRPVRLMHPRYPIYVVPRGDGVFVVGATAIESEDRGPVTVRSVMELLSA